MVGVGIAALGVSQGTWDALQSSALRKYDEYSVMLAAVQAFSNRDVGRSYDRTGRQDRSGIRELQFYSKLVKMLYEVSLVAGDAPRLLQDLQRVHLWYCFQLNSMPPPIAFSSRRGGTVPAGETPAGQDKSPPLKSRGRKVTAGDPAEHVGTTFAVRFLSTSFDRPRAEYDGAYLHALCKGGDQLVSCVPPSIPLSPPHSHAALRLLPPSASSHLLR